MVLPSLPSRGVTLEISLHIVVSHVCDWFSCVWSLQDLEGLGDALLVTPAAATVCMEGDLSKHAAASAVAVLLPALKARWSALTVAVC